MGRGAVQQNGHALGYAAAELRADRAVVMAAAKTNGAALWYASKELPAAREKVKAPQ